MYSIFYFFLIIPIYSYSWVVVPQLQEVNFTKPQCFFDVQYENGDDKVQVEAIVVKRTMDEMGKEAEEPITSEFIIFPKMFSFKNKKTMSVRIIWKKKRKIDLEENYRIVFKQNEVCLPTSLDEENSEELVDVGIKFSKEYHCSLFVVPDKAAPKMEIVEKKYQSIEDQKYISLKVKNIGSKRKVYALTSVIVKDGSSKKIIPESKIKENHLDHIVVFAGNERYINIPIDFDVDNENFDVELQSRT